MSAISALGGFANKLFMPITWETPRKKVTLGILFIYKMGTIKFKSAL